MHTATSYPDAHTHESEPSDFFRAAPLDSPWIRKIRNTGFPEPPPPPDSALIALQPLSAAALRNSLQASSRIKEDTKDTAALGYLRESRIAACFVYRYTVPPPSRPPGPTRQQLRARQELDEYNEGVRRMNATTRADNLRSRKQNTPEPPAPDLPPVPSAQSPVPSPQAPAPLLRDEPDAPASVPTPSPQRTPPPPARSSHHQPIAQPSESSAPSAPSAFNASCATHNQESSPPLPIAQSPLPAPHPFEHSERLRPFDSNALPARSWFFEPNAPSDSSAPSAFNASHSTELPPPRPP
jgi:hypothetical protein